jgi:hypothetical protein
LALTQPNCQKKAILTGHLPSKEEVFPDEADAISSTSSTDVEELDIDDFLLDRTLTQTTINSEVNASQEQSAEKPQDG